LHISGHRRALKSLASPSIVPATWLGIARQPALPIPLDEELKGINGCLLIGPVFKGHFDTVPSAVGCRPALANHEGISLSSSHLAWITFQTANLHFENGAPETPRNQSRVTLKSLMNDEPNGCGVGVPPATRLRERGNRLAGEDDRQNWPSSHIRDREMHPYYKDTYVQLLCQAVGPPHFNART
jgi:hypothetical protein